MKDKLLKWIHIAELYYYDHLTQAEIAKRLGVSRSSVSMALTEVRKLGLVQIKIQKPYSNKEYVAASLTKKFRLKTCQVIAATGKNESSLYQMILRSAAERLSPYWKKAIRGGSPAKISVFSF